MDVANRPRFPSRFRPKPYAWHAAAFTALAGAQIASDREVFPRKLSVGPISPFDYFGNIPWSTAIGFGTSYATLGLLKNAGLNTYNEWNKPTKITRVGCAAIGATFGLLANSIVETRTGLSILRSATDVYSNEGGINGGNTGDLIAGTVAATLSGAIAPSTFRTLSKQIER